MSDWDAELDYAQREERKFFSDSFRHGVWTPYAEARLWRRRFWWAMLAVASLVGVIVRGTV